MSRYGSPSVSLLIEQSWIAKKLEALGFVDAKSELHSWDMVLPSLDAFRPMLKGMTCASPALNVADRSAYTLKTAWTDGQIERHLSDTLANAERLFADRALSDGRIPMPFVSPISFAHKPAHSCL